MQLQDHIKGEAAQNAAIGEWMGPLSEARQEQLQDLIDQEQRNNNRHARHCINGDMDALGARRRAVKNAKLSPVEITTRVAIQDAAVDRLCRGRYKLTRPSSYILLRPIVWLLPHDRDRLRAGEFLFKHVQLMPGEPPKVIEFSADMLSEEAIGGALELLEGRPFSKDAVRTLLFRAALTNYFKAMRAIANVSRQNFEKPDAVIAKIDGILVHIRQRDKQRGWKFVDAVFSEFLRWSHRL
jgi:hypothetical protein